MSADKRRAELLKKVLGRFQVETENGRGRDIWLSVSKDELMRLLAFLKEIGFDHCSAISVSDWPKEGVYELAYHLWSYAEKLLLTVKTRIDREGSAIESAVPLWGESAQIHEREAHELFGVSFLGNPDLTPLFLEDWDGPPPFRKDFDWRDYVRAEFYDQGNEREKAYWD